MIDFSDLGGVSVKENNPIDFSDLGGQKVQSFSNAQSNVPWYQKVSNFEKNIGEAVSRVISPVTPVIDAYNKSQQGSPVEILKKINELINQGAGAVGENVATGLAGEGLATDPLAMGPRVKLNPEAAAAVGTGISMAPDIAMSFANPVEGVESTAAKLGKNKYAQEKLLSAIGTPKRLLKDPNLVRRAEEHAQVLLENGLAKPLRGTKGLAEELTNLESSSGEKIGAILDTLGEKGKVFNPRSAIDEINKLRPISKSTGKVLRGGAYDKINSKIDDAVATIEAHLHRNESGQVFNRPLSFQEANDLKGVLQSQANYASNKDATLLDKIIAGKFRGSVDESLENAAREIGDPALAEEFQKSKKLYGATQFASDPVYNKLATEISNKKIGLTDWILGSSSLATGNPLTAVVEVGLKKGIEKFGPITQATVSNRLSTTPKLLTPGLKTAGLSQLMQAINPSTQSPLIDLLNNLPQNREAAVPHNPPTPPQLESKSPALEIISSAKPAEKRASKNRVLDEQTALSYLDAAGNDPQKARAMAMADGWTIP